MSNYDLPDDPIIQNMERTGYPDGKEPRSPRCPVCGEECETLFTSDLDGSIAGCDVCLTEHDAWKREECFPENERSYQDD